MRASTLDAFCKIYRATEHLYTLDAALAAFLKPDCYEIVNDAEVIGKVSTPPDAPVRAVLRRRVIFKRNPPLLYWGTIIGDVVHNLRSALDHIVYTISYRGNPAEFANDNTTAFPICDQSNTFHARRRREWKPLHEIRGIPPEAQAIIEGLQPYNRGNVAMKSDPLWILREMDDIDKHRTIHISGWSAHAIALDITELMPGVRLHSHSIRPTGAIESGAILVEIDYSADFAIVNPDVPAMYMDKEFLFTIAFSDDTPLAGQQVQAALFDLSVYVQGIVNALNRFVPK